MIKLPSLYTALLGTMVAVGAMFAVPTSRAAVLATYDFQDYTTSTGTSAPNATLGSGILSASNFVANGGTVTPPTGFLGRAGSGGPGNYMFTTTLTTTAFGLQALDTYDTQQGAIDGATYYSFTITPNAGAALSFPTGSALTYQSFVRINSGTASPFTANFFFQTNASGSFVTLGTPVAQTQTGVGNTGATNQSLDLSSLGTLAVGQALTFHFLVFDNQQASADDMKFDNFVINGTALVPEPSTLAMSGLSLVGVALLALRRRRQTA